MYNYLHQYFAANKKLSLPGIGSFSVTTTPADLDFINRSVKAPLLNIIFHPAEAIADESFVEFLSVQTRTNAQDCASALDDFSNAVLQKLKTGETENLPGIGTIKLEKKNYIFTADNSIQQYFPTVIAEKIVRPNASHTVKVGEDEKTSEEMHELLNTAVKKDQWWIAAAVLAAAAVIVIVTYHLTR